MNMEPSDQQGVFADDAGPWVITAEGILRDIFLNGDCVGQEQLKGDASMLLHACDRQENLLKFIEDYVAAEEKAIKEWDEKFPRLPWQQTHEAMARLNRARELLNPHGDV